MASINEPTTKMWLASLLEPSLLLLWAMSYHVKVNLEAVFKRGQILAPLLQSGRLRDEAFGRFWVSFSNAVDSQPPRPPTQAGVQSSSDLIPPVLAHASGLVLDVGPGTGTQMPLLRSPAIKAIYGAEPCHGLHAKLRSRANAEGVGEKYHVLPCSVVVSELVPALQKQGLLPAGTTALDQTTGGVFDSIICVRVLCSVPDLEQSARDLYALLKPGGKILVVEHVVNPWRTAKGSVVARMMQALYGFLGWSWYIGDCRMNRDTEKALRGAAESDGGWESVEVERWFGRTCMPYIAGTFVKRG
ncbi:S-adenosyl-L-methionine-dependent methyltransferase [Aspergillus caelatus]|uniref:S-adenosyl-L-methionine-dependent methyltransferase n=1 Tax=Aspergillus caelatus TaxID=61420 RepID=A0A5N6ZPK6_9EURO|nr:S-adenosyl-L-methionine-dependent methyltransferase [Aspergillus caelatus]KAE8359308.1 S-adenosyl-L-methionine-dependent methyltransferase [Aspergillus caelatus]